MELLLVEPHHVLARALKKGLGEEGFAVEVVSDQERADERLRESGYDVILLDLPAGNSLHTFRRWRRTGLRTPVLVFTTSECEVDQRALSSEENFDISVKPFAFEELLARVRSLVQNGARMEMSESKENSGFPLVRAAAFGHEA